MTVLCTYQCTAACKQCCFESSPHVKARIDRYAMLDRITEAKHEFPSLELVVFSGGEATLLKGDLFDAIRLAGSLGMRTRIVSNGSWGKTPHRARSMAESLHAAGLGELNISTGKDHQEWVPSTSVLNAACAAVDLGLRTLVTVEADDDESSCLHELVTHPDLRTRMSTPILSVQTNYWMPFKSDAEARIQRQSLTTLRTGCSQVFDIMVVTPHDNLSACCGLTLEHIPEMGLGKLDGSNLGELYRSQAEDFLKFWIHMDGPYAIIERLLGPDSGAVLDDVVHMCQACVLMHQHPRVRDALEAQADEIIPEVMTRFHIKRALEIRERRAATLPQIPMETVA